MKTGEGLQLNILAIDTSTDAELLALSVNGKVYQFCANLGRSHSVTMFQNMSALLNEASISVNDINLIGTGIGPGSFTGIRIAVSTARMLAQILKVPLVGIKSPEIYASSAIQSGEGTVLAAFDAKKSRVFAGVYSIKDRSITEIIEPGDYYIEEMLSSVPLKGELVCVGDGSERYIETIESCSVSAGYSCRLVKGFLPDGEAAVELTLGKYLQSPELYSDYSNIVPFYSRKSDAELAKSIK